MKTTLSVLLCLLFLAEVASARVENDDYAKNVLPNMFSAGSAEMIWMSGSLLTLGGFTLDKKVNHYLFQNRLADESLTWYGHAYLDRYVALGLVAAGALEQALTQDDYLTPIRYSVSALGLTGVATFTLKKITSRTRPSGKPNSFPSGHTSITFASATVLNQWYGPKIGIPAYTMAAFTAFSRMQDHYHWFSDVLFGATVGIAIPYGLMLAEKEFQSVESDRNFPPVTLFRWNIQL